MDFRFKYDRKKPPPAVQAERARREHDSQKISRGLAYGLTIPMMMLSGPLGGWLLWSWLKGHTAWGSDITLVVLILLGTAASFYMVVDLLGRLSKS
jgi:F0F1-type ATP synthase assembly protein I